MSRAAGAFQQLSHGNSFWSGQKRQIGFEALCDGVPAARSARSGLASVSTHRSRRCSSARRIGSEAPLLVGHPGLEAQ